MEEARPELLGGGRKVCKFMIRKKKMETGVPEGTELLTVATVTNLTPQPLLGVWTHQGNEVWKATDSAVNYLLVE